MRTLHQCAELAGDLARRSGILIGTADPGCCSPVVPHRHPVRGGSRHRSSRQGGDLVPRVLLYWVYLFVGSAAQEPVKNTCGANAGTALPAARNFGIAGSLVGRLVRGGAVAAGRDSIAGDGRAQNRRSQEGGESGCPSLLGDVAERPRRVVSSKLGRTSHGSSSTALVVFTHRRARLGTGVFVCPIGCGDEPRSPLLEGRSQVGTAHAGCSAFVGLVSCAGSADGGESIKRKRENPAPFR